MARLREFEYDSLQDRESIVKYLDAISQGFARGRLVFGSEGERMILEPQGLIKFSIKVSDKSDKVKLSVKFTWTDRDEKLAKKKPLEIESIKE